MLAARTPAPKRNGSYEAANNARRGHVPVVLRGSTVIVDLIFTLLHKQKSSNFVYRASCFFFPFPWFDADMCQVYYLVNVPCTGRQEELRYI